MTTFDRTTYLAARDTRAAARPPRPTLADTLSIENLAVLRIRCRYRRNFTAYHDVVGFTANYERIPLEDVVQADLALWAQLEFPAVDWSRDHQIWLAYGCIHAAPDADEAGFIPEDDLTFAGGPAVLLERQAVTA